jgi:hypothetical protein
VNVSNFKLGIYEFLGLVIPGMFVVSEGWIAIRGWPQFVNSLAELHPVSFTLFVAASFVAGHFIQELADWGIKRVCGDRFFKKGRDKVWAGGDGESIKSAIWAESGLTLGTVDSAFDYCLTRVGDAFSKRDVFLGTSDFARSFLVLAVCGVGPALRLASDRTRSTSGFFLLLVFYIAVLIVVARLAWRRMIRFRHMSDHAVFGAYLGSRPAKNTPEGETAPKLRRGRADAGVAL